jgi:hypothetical protein
LNRWGGRAWGGVGLASALVVTFSIVAARPQPSRAGVSQSDPFNSQAATTFPRPTDPSVGYSPTRQPAVRPSLTETANPSDDSATAQAGRPTSVAKQNVNDRAAAEAQNPAAGDPDHVGTGSASTEGPHSLLPPPTHSGSKSDAGGHGRTAGGGQSDITAASGGNGPTGVSGNTSGQKTSPPAPPWTTASWPQDRERALDQIRSSPSYESYRELIRSYFDRE